MTPNKKTPQADMRKLLEEMNSRVDYFFANPSESGIDWMPIEAQDLETLLSYIHTLEAEHKRMREWFGKCLTVGEPISGQALRREATNLLSPLTLQP